MKLASVCIRNFRCYRDKIKFDIDDLTALIGRNDSGKSAVLDALNVFFNFREAKLDRNDASVDGDPKKLEITCEFSDLPLELVIDATHSTSLQDEYLVNKLGRLQITKVYDASLVRPRERETFLTANHPTVTGAHDLLSLKNQDLKKRAADLGVLDNVDNQSINASLRSAIRGHFEDLALSEARVTVSELEKGSGKEIWHQLELALPAYFLFRADRSSTDQDDEAQDPLKAAVKSALEQVNNELTAIANRVNKEAAEITADALEKLRDLDDSLARELNPRFADPTWHTAFKITVEDNDGIPINKRGSGVRRLILLSFLQAEAERSPRAKGRRLIYAVEEPETSQHPNTQRLVYHALDELSRRADTQVITTTHIPALGALLPESSIRFIEVTDDGKRVAHGPQHQTYRLAAQALGVLPNHTIKIFVGVEGGNDISFLRQISAILNRSEKDLPDLGALEDNNMLMFIPFAGSNLHLWVTRLAALACPEIHIVDRDTHPPASPKYQAQVDQINERTGCSAYITSVREMENYLHTDAIASALGVRVTVEDHNDIPELVAEQLHLANDGQVAWAALSQEKREKKTRRAKKRLNSEAAEAMTVQMLDERDSNRDIRSWLAAINAVIQAES